jgi:hypothetical protein
MMILFYFLKRFSYVPRLRLSEVMVTIAVNQGYDF